MRIWKWVGLGAALLAAAAAFGVYSTERAIASFEARIARIAEALGAPTPRFSEIEDLPAPVQRYFAFVFPDGPTTARLARISAEGRFRRPRTTTFNPMTAEQVVAIDAPAFMFSATTEMAPGLWARAYDFFADGEMEMKAKILSLITVVDERETPELNAISLRRWLLESALFPQALLPGGPARWEAVDADSARLLIEAEGLRATMIARFDDVGRMTEMAAEEDGDLDTPYHGSGEHVTRGDYQRIGDVMIPMRFAISRAADGEIHPFWEGRITSVRFDAP